MNCLTDSTPSTLNARYICADTLFLHEWFLVQMDNSTVVQQVPPTQGLGLQVLDVSIGWMSLSLFFFSLDAFKADTLLICLSTFPAKEKSISTIPLLVVEVSTVFACTLCQCKLCDPL